jgi:hypothetical protein
MFGTGAAILLMKNIRACESLRRNSMASFSLADGGSFFWAFTTSSGRGRLRALNSRPTESDKVDTTERRGSDIILEIAAGDYAKTNSFAESDKSQQSIGFSPPWREECDEARLADYVVAPLARDTISIIFPSSSSGA